MSTTSIPQKFRGLEGESVTIPSIVQQERTGEVIDVIIRETTRQVVLNIDFDERTATVPASIVY